MNLDIANLALNIGQANTKDWVDVFSALLTPTVAILAVYIALQQWQTQEKQRKQDLYEKRYDNLYYPIILCTEKISKIKEKNISEVEKNNILEKEIQQFWLQYHKYKFLISNQDDEKLTNCYNYIIEILKKYNTNPNNKNKSQEDISFVLTLLCHLATMESTLAKYLRIENDCFIYKIKKYFQTKFNYNTIKNCFMEQNSEDTNDF